MSSQTFYFNSTDESSTTELTNSTEIVNLEAYHVGRFH